MSVVKSLLCLVKYLTSQSKTYNVRVSPMHIRDERTRKMVRWKAPCEEEKRTTRNQKQRDYAESEKKTLNIYSTRLDQYIDATTTTMKTILGQKSLQKLQVVKLCVVRASEMSKIPLQCENLCTHARWDSVRRRRRCWRERENTRPRQRRRRLRRRKIHNETEIVKVVKRKKRLRIFRFIHIYIVTRFEFGF